MSESLPPLPAAPVAPGYLDELCQLFAHVEPDLWAWFAGDDLTDPDVVAEAEVALLQTAYRLDGDVHGILTADAALLAGQLGLDHEITLYQALHDGDRNARVELLGSGVHVVFAGDLLDLLSAAERQAVLAHELAHVQLLVAGDGRYRVLGHLAERLAAEPGAHPALAETARRIRLHVEVHADAVAARLVGDRDALISAVVKVSSGLRNVDPRAYLRQAEELLQADEPGSAAWTHPELHVRVACLAANTEPFDTIEPAPTGPARSELVRSLIDGPDDLDRLDVLGQLRLQKLSARVLSAGRRVVGPSPAVDAHLAAFPSSPPSLSAAPAHPHPPEPAGLDDGELAAATPSVRHLAAALLVDLALVADDEPEADDLSDPAVDADDENHDDERVEPGLGPLRALSAEAERIGVEADYDRILAGATAQTLADVRRLRARR